MTDYIVGAFNKDKSKNFKKIVKNKMFSYFDSTESKTVLVDSKSLILVSNAKDKVHSLLQENVCIAYLGEITGYLVPIPGEYKDNNTLILWFLNKRYGNGFAKHINGHFVIILWDKNLDQFLLIQDKFPGIKTLYWTVISETIFFSNYIKPLLALRHDSFQINKQGLYQFLKRAYISAPNTIFNGIWQVEAGKIIKVHNNNLTTHEYDPWQFHHERITNEKEAIEEYRNLLSNSIQHFLSMHPTSGFLLSGGLDSSVNVALAKEHSRDPLTTINVGSINYNTDRPFALKVAKLFNTTHHDFLVEGAEINELPQTIWQMENPYYDPGIMLISCALKHARNYMKCIIGGDVADQVFGASTSRAYQRVKINKKTFGSFSLLQRLINTICKNQYTEGNYLLRKIENKLVGKYDINNWGTQYGFRICDLKQMLRTNFYFEEKYDNRKIHDCDLHELFEFTCINIMKDYALYGILIKSGRMADMFGINVFSPYIDKNVFNFLMSLDHSLRTPPVKNELGKFDVKHLHVELAKQFLPPDIISRPKQGGAIHAYIHLENKKRIESIRKVILKSQFLNELFHMPLINNLFNNTELNSVKIIMLLSLDLWHYLFIKNFPISKPQFKLDEYLENSV